MTVRLRAASSDDQLLFQFAESRFAVLVKNVRDGPARARLNQFVRVEIIEMQLVGHQPAHGRLARAHETDEREIDEVAVVVHGHGLTDFRARRTPIIVAALDDAPEPVEQPSPARVEACVG